MADWTDVLNLYFLDRILIKRSREIECLPLLLLTLAFALVRQGQVLDFDCDFGFDAILYI